MIYTISSLDEFSGELSTPKANDVKTPKRTKSQIEKEIALLTNSENILGFRFET